jgi:hypothetical protein
VRSLFLARQALKNKTEESPSVETTNSSNNKEGNA